MDVQHDFHLIKGRFSASEAELLLRELAQAKIQHHMRQLSWQGNVEEDIKFLEKRIREIETGLRTALQHVKSSADGNGQVDIDGMVTVRAV